MGGPITAQATDLNVSAVEGDGVTFGVTGTAQDGWGVNGTSKKQVGVRGYCDDGWGVAGESKNQIGVRGTCAPGWGVAGDSTDGIGVRGTCANAFGVTGESAQGTGVYGKSTAPDGSKGQAGVMGEFDNGVGVFGRSSTSSGVGGMSQSGIGVHGVSDSSEGVRGDSTSMRGVYGHSVSQAGVVGESDQFDGVFGISHNPQHAGVSGHNPGGLAGFFDGDVEVTGDIRLVNADCAEQFDIAESTLVEPGTVMVVGAAGILEQSSQAYDRRVAGVVSGAGRYKPGIVLDSQPSPHTRLPIALMGKVYCKVDARHEAIAVGDLLTTAPAPGYAMKAADPARAFGAIIGKALCPLQDGQGLIPILVALQ